MQKDWNRRHDFVALDEPTLASMLQPVFSGKQIAEVELLTAGLCNTNYKIKLAGLTGLIAGTMENWERYGET